MTRRCSHCSNNGHNSRTCPTRSSGGSGGGGLGPKIFGVRLDGSIIKKSASMGNLSSAHYHSSSSAAASPNPDSPSSDLIRDQMIHVSDGYLSDDPAHASVSANRRAERKKGIPWTEEEHRRFLVGLQNLGKGDWRGIARNFVVSRTPTQVASHAQKYFIRHSSTTRRKRRSSLFDMASDMAMDTPPVPEEQLLPPPQSGETDHPNSVLSLNLSLGNEFEPMDATSHEVVKEREENVESSSSVLPFAPVYYQTYLPPAGYSFMPSNLVPAEEDKGETSHHQVLKPIPILPKKPLNVDELVGMSQLSLGETERGHNSSSPLSLKLVLGGPSRQSAFHANTPVSGSELSDGKSSAIQAI